MARRTKKSGYKQISGAALAGAGECALPSSSAAKNFLKGEDGGAFEMVAATALRSILIAPGLYLAGVRDRKLIAASLLSSTMITGFVVGYLALTNKAKKRRK